MIKYYNYTSYPESPAMLYNFIFKANGEYIKSRIDLFLFAQLKKLKFDEDNTFVSNISRSMIQKYLSNNQVYNLATNKFILDKNYKIQINDCILLFNNFNFYNQSLILTSDDNYKLLDDNDKNHESTNAFVPRIKIVYEDEALIVVDKPSNLVVHPEPKYKNISLVHLLWDRLQHFNATDISVTSRPGIVHRLDKDTSGLILVAKDAFSLFNLSEQIKARSVSRIYQALVYGIPKKTKSTITTLITRDEVNRLRMKVSHVDGKIATTHYRVLEVFEKLNISLVECVLDTGRTHQIRVHMKHIGHPIVGDQTYKTNINIKTSSNMAPVVQDLLNFSRQALHAMEIKFFHPKYNNLMHFKSTFPDDIQSLIDKITNQESESA